VIARLLPPGSTARRSAAVVGAFVATLLFTQLVLPGSGHGAARGAPMAILFSGFVTGAVNALTAAGLVLVYRTTRIINWAQTAIGAAGATLCFDFLQYTRVPFLLAFFLGLALAALTGAFFELVVVRRFFRSPRLVLTVVTILGGQAIAGLSNNIGKLPFFPKVQDLTLVQALNVQDLRGRLPFAGFTFHVGHLPLPFGFAEVFALEAAVLGLLLLAAFFRFTRAGVGVRALAENLERASLLGISVGVLSSVVWILAGMLSGVTTTLTGFLATPANAVGFAPSVLLIALAAAVIGRMRSLPITVVAALLLSVVVQASSFALPNDRPLVSVGLFVLICVGLLVQRRTLLRSDEVSGQSWETSEEQRPVPKELRRVSSVRITRVAFIAVGLAFVVIYPFLVPTRLMNLGGVIALATIVILSLVVLTGWAGQVSLGQYAFAAIGAVIGGALTARVGIPFWFAVPIAAGVTAGCAALVGLPALRIRGLFLAVTTFALAFAVRGALFSHRYFGWLLPKGDNVKRPTLFFLDFGDERSMYFLCVAALVVVLVIVTNLRRSRFGRLLIAMRDSEANVQSFGVSVVRLKISAFAMSGAIAGFAGAVFVHQQQGLNGGSFEANTSLQVFILAVLGGITSPAGALLGSAYGQIVQYFLSGNVIVAALLAFGGPLVLVYLAPGGLISVITKLRDAGLRIIAQRRQLVVPSLFADYDPEALEARLIPLADPAIDAGLGVLSHDDPFTLASDLYRGKGVRIVDRLAPAKVDRETAALTAAADRAQEDAHARTEAPTP
jgi:branched-chain amino acid transport system permease protein